MSSNEQVLKLIKKQNNFFKENIGWIYPNDNSEAEYWVKLKERLQRRVLNREKWELADDYLIKFSNWYVDYSQYAWAKLGDRKLQQKAFRYSAWCSYKAMKVKLETTRIRGYKSGFLSGDVLFWWSNLFLAGWQAEADEIMAYVLSSTIDNGGLIDEGGTSLDTFPHFLIELYCLWQEKPYKRADYRHSELYLDLNNDSKISRFIYNPVLEHWSSNDLLLVDELITQMCDYHVERTVETTADVSKDEEGYYEFWQNNYRLYPFEVLVWLKIRELVGLENPTDFSHPLMNQPLAEPITDAPLEKPIDHIETNQILDLVRKHFPEAKV